MALLAALPFAGSLRGTFVYDDHVLIERPESVHSLGRVGELWQGEFWRGLETVHFRYLRPLVSTSYALDWSLWDGQPFGFHLTNLGLHAAVSAMLYAALRRWSASPVGALLATLAWAWHPSKVEAVAWISGRTDLLCALGILLACVGIRKRLDGARAVGGALELAGLFVALSSKEHAVVAPAFVAVEAWAHGGNRALDRAELLRLSKVVAPHAAVVGVYLAFRFLLYPIVPERTATLSFFDARLYTLETLGEFTKIVFFPFRPSIQRAPIRVDESFRVIHDPWRILLGAMFLCAMGAAMFIWRTRRSTRRLWGCALGLAALAPVANIGAAKMVFLFAERFAYIPLMGFALCIAPLERPRLQGLAPWGVLLAVCGWGSARQTDRFLDDRRFWQHELAENPMQPLALRFACQEAMRRQRFHEALELAVRGYEAARGWPVPQPDRVEFALRAARSLESVTLDARRAVLEQVAEFYDTFFRASGTARIDVDPVHVAIDAGGNEARNFRNRDPERLAQIELWRAVVASRLERCDTALRAVESYLLRTQEPSGRISAVLVLARCGHFRRAHEVAATLDTAQPPIAELVRNLGLVESVAAAKHDDLDGALRWSRARTLLIDRRGAYRALLPFRDAILADAEGAVFFARTAWAAGEDEAARQALAHQVNPQEVEALLSSWSRELGRTP